MNLSHNRSIIHLDLSLYRIQNEKRNLTPDPPLGLFSDLTVFFISAEKVLCYPVLFNRFLSFCVLLFEHLLLSMNRGGLFSAYIHLV